MSAHISTSKLLAVQDICAVVLCKQCKIAFPSERSAKAHLSDKHSVDAVKAKHTTERAFKASEAVLVIPNPLRDVYMHAPDPAPNSPVPKPPFFRPLEGLAIIKGFHCTLCTACYSSEKGMRTHIADKHNVAVDMEWKNVEQNGSLDLQSIFNGNKTKYFPVSVATPLGSILSPPHSASHKTPSQKSFQNSQHSSPSPNLSNSPSLLFNDHVHKTFNDLDHALFSCDLSNNSIPRSHLNPYLASTNFDCELQEHNIDMKTAAHYTGILDDYSQQETQVVLDVKAFLNNIPDLIPDISSALLQQINLTAENDFRQVSNKAADRYARTIARVVICAIRLCQSNKKLVSPTIATHLDAYLSAFSNTFLCDHQNRLVLLHTLLASIFLSTLDTMDSPKRLFVRQFIVFATIIPNSRNQEDSFRCANSKDISPILAALLYATSCSAVFEIHKLRIRSESLSSNQSSPQLLTNDARKKLDSKMQTVLAALNVSNNNAASFIRKTLDLANAISRHEDVDFIFDICQRHTLCGIVDNIHISMPRLGEVIKHLHKQIDKSFTFLLHGAPFPSGFFSHIADISDHIQDKAPGSSFLTQGNMMHRSRKYAVWLFSQITELRSSGRALFSVSTTSPTDVVKVFGKTINKAAAQQWLSKIQAVQDMLLACTHISSGSPGRATELETLHLLNSEFALRNLYITQGKLTLVTRYSKSRSLTGWDRVIPRFPDPATSKHFLTYLVLFRTLETVFVKALYGSSVMKSHLRAVFVERGTPYSASRIRDVIRAAFRDHNLPIEFNHFRHFTAGMVPVITQSSPHIIREDIIAETREIAHLQSGHSPLVAEHNYARKPSDIPSMTSTALNKYRLFSSEWHRSLGLLSESPSPSNQTPTSSFSVSSNDLRTVSNIVAASFSQNISQLIQNRIEKISSDHSPNKRSQHSTPRQANATFFPKKPRYEIIRSPPQRDIEKDLSEYLPSLRKFLRTKDALFRSETQLMVTQAICDAKHDVLAVMPTGSGKTISLLLPVFLEGEHSSTVVIVPLAILVKEYVQKCRSFGISVATWSDRHQQVQLYVISADHNRKDMEDFLRTLQNKGRLRRLVLDEAHLIVTWLLFRNSFQRLPYSLKCRGHYIQFVLLTATLPPVYMERVLQILSIPSIVLYAQPTVRNNLKFHVINSSLVDPFQSNEGRIRSHVDIMTDVLCKQLSKVCRNLINNNGGRILVFTLYRYEAERLAQVITNHIRTLSSSQTIPVRSYHAAMPHSALTDIFSFWKSDDHNIKIVVSTSAFGTGLDVPDVRAVFHFGGSNGLLDYVQETGRAGRDGLPADCTIIYNKQYADQHTAKINSSSQQQSFATQQDILLTKQEWEFMNNYMSQKLLCRKNQLYYHVDSQAPGMCIFDPNSLNCDICNAIQHPKTNRQPSLSPQSVSPTPSTPSFLRPLPIPPSANLPPTSQNAPLPSNSLDSPLLSYPFGTQPQAPDFVQSNPPSNSQNWFPFSDQLGFQPQSSHFQQSNSQTSQPQAPIHTLPHSSPNVPDPHPVRRRLSFSTSGATDTILSDFRTAVHSLQNLCVACLVINGSKQLNQHNCRHMKNRCKRCFFLGHQVVGCKTFDPKRKNFCFRCSLSQIQGENVHKQGEFGMNCFMGVARDLAWMFWSSGSQSQTNIANALFNELEIQKFLECRNDVTLTQEFYVTWLRTQWDGVPNLVRLVLWWHNSMKL